MATTTRPTVASRNPQGHPTRGKTARNRLRRVDTFLLRYDPGLIRRTHGGYAGAAVVDLGYGAAPVTTVEMAARLRRLNPTLPVIGVEIDPARVDAAQPYADARTRFRLGGFNLPVAAAEPVRLVRAFNVLRQYEEAAVADAWRQLGRAVLPGGLLIDGTSDPCGQIWTANVLRRTEGPETPWRPELLVFSTNFRLPFDPGDFQTVLPKNLIHQVTPGTPVHAFFAAWTRAARRTMRYRSWGNRQWFAAAARDLALDGVPVNTSRRWLRQGYLLLRGSALATMFAEMGV